jgi:hypothetical protein
LRTIPPAERFTPRKPFTHFYAVGPNGELADVVVSLKVTGQSTGAAATPAVLDQKGCLYSSHHSGRADRPENYCQEFRSLHSQRSYGFQNGNQEHNDAQMSGGADLTYTFDKPEDFMKFQCDVHPWMFAWVTIEDSPYFALSGKDGSFTIKNVPPGKYTITASHRKLGPQTQDVEVKDS